MSPMFSFLLGLVALIPFSLSIPTRPAGGLSLPGISFPSNGTPLPPSPGGWYDIPGTTLSIHAVEPYGPALPSLQNAIAAVTAAKSSIDASQRPDTQLPPRPRTWHASSSQVHITASSVFSHLGTCGQLSSAMTGLWYLLSTPGQVGARQFTWVVADDIQGVIILGEITTGTPQGRTLLASGSRTATNTTESAVSEPATSVAPSASPKVSVTGYRLYSDETN